MKLLCTCKHKSFIDKPFEIDDIVIYKDEEYYIDKIYKEYCKPSGLISITNMKDERIRIRVYSNCVNKTDRVVLRPSEYDGICEFKGDIDVKRR